jgi:parvulin-like peptidyl-prolyl isomerase
MRNPRRCFRLAAGPWLAAGLIACGGSPDRLVVAEVGDHEITAADLADFGKRLPDGVKQGKTPLDVQRNLLESLIDKTILEMEAGRTRVEDDAWFKAKVEGYRKSRLLRMYGQREVSDRVLITEEEMLETYRTTGRDRALRFSGITVKTRAEALQMLDRLKKGAAFNRLAAEYSLERRAAERGGDVGGYKRKDQLDPVLAERLFRLRPGELSEPIAHRYGGQPCYTVFKITDEMPVPMETAEPMVREDLLARESAARMGALTDSLARAYAPQVHGDRVRWLSQYTQRVGVDSLALPEAEGRQAVCSYRGGAITLAELLQEVQEMQLGGPELADSARVADIVQRMVLPQRLFLEEIRRARLDEDPGILADLARKREELLLDALRRRDVDRFVEASEAEARAFFDQHPEKFAHPETIVISETLVSTEAKAQEVRAQLEAGVDPETLATRLTIRLGAAPHGGKIRLNMHIRALFPEIFDLVQQLEAGQIGGPLRVRDGFSVFKILGKERKAVTYDKDAQRRATAYVKIDKANRGYVAYVRGLRERYPVRILADNLETMSRTTPAAK